MQKLYHTSKASINIINNINNKINKNSLIMKNEINKSNL